MPPRHPMPNHPPHERRDVPLRYVVLFCLAFLIGGALLHGALLLVLRFYHRADAAWLRAHETTPVAAGVPTAPPPLPLLTSPELLNTLHARAKTRLSSYGWVNQRAGIAHIPIEAAMAQVARAGLPAWPTPTSFTLPLLAQPQPGQVAP